MRIIVNRVFDSLKIAAKQCLPDMSILIRQKLCNVPKTKMRYFKKFSTMWKCSIFGGFQTSVKMRIAKVKKISHENIAMQTLEIRSICPNKTSLWSQFGTFFTLLPLCITCKLRPIFLFLKSRYVLQFCK